MTIREILDGYVNEINTLKARNKALEGKVELLSKKNIFLNTELNSLKELLEIKENEKYLEQIVINDDTQNTEDSDYNVIENPVLENTEQKKNSVNHKREKRKENKKN